MVNDGFGRPIDLPPELAPAKRAEVEKLLAEVQLAQHREHRKIPGHTMEGGQTPCWACGKRRGPKSGHHLIPGDDSSVVLVHKSCHRKLHAA